MTANMSAGVSLEREESLWDELYPPIIPQAAMTSTSILLVYNILLICVHILWIFRESTEVHKYQKIKLSNIAISSWLTTGCIQETTNVAISTRSS